MKKLFILVVSLLLCYSISAQDFRKVSWGDDKEIIRVSEPGVEWKETPSDSLWDVFDNLSFEAEILGIPATVTYSFIDDELAFGTYKYNAIHVEYQGFIVDYLKVNEALQSKYGEGDEFINWMNELYKSDYSQWGKAMALGHLRMSKSWEIDNRTAIINHISGREMKISHGVYYSSIAHRDIIAKRREEKRAREVEEVF